MKEPIIKDLEEDDLKNGFLDTLKSLTTVGKINDYDLKQRFNKIVSDPNYIIKVAKIDGEIIGTATLFVELKFIHQLGKVGHIEDVVADKKFQGHGIGSRIIHTLLAEAKKRGCYKTILDCDEKVIPFYEKINFEGKSFHKHGYCLRFDHED